MDRLIALFAFLVFLGFVAILAFEVHSPDLWAVIALTVALVAADIGISAFRRKD